VGAALGVVEGMVVVQADGGAPPLGEGSVMVLTEQRAAIGRVEEVFGQVGAPVYAFRALPGGDGGAPPAPAAGAAVSTVRRTARFLVPESLYSKGYDASGKDDEELPAEQQEQSDDEAEREIRGRGRRKRQGGAGG